MGALKKFVIAVLVFSALVFVVLFGQIPAFRNTPISFANRLIRVHIPRGLKYADHTCTGGRISKYSKRLGRYLLGSNPVVLIGFLLLLTSSASLFIYSAWNRLGHGHHGLICLLLPLPYVFTYKSTYCTDSYITVANHAAEMRVYPYDHTIFYPGHICRTCHLLKPPRSKHCSTCNACVSRHDHHCIWINNCVGRTNYRWFLALLLSLGCVLVYGAILAWNLLLPQRPRPRAPGILAYLDAWGVAVSRDALIGAIGLLALLTWPLAWGLLGYHFYLIWAGMTTNETAKWGDLKDDMRAGAAFKGTKNMLPREYLRRGVQAGVEELEPPTLWPAKSEQVVLTTSDGRPPYFGNRGKEEHARHAGQSGDREWQQCWRLSDVDNLYDLGFRRNLVLDAMQMQR